MGSGSIALAFLAGVLSTLSPCVLPLLPLVLGTAVSAHRFGPAALAAGLATSFVAIGLFVATIGFSIGLDGGVFRIVAAALLTIFGVMLMASTLQTRLAVAAGPVGDWADRRFGGFATNGLQGQFAVGLLLGAVWSPCVGPTLGAASLLATQGKDLWHVAAVMITFGISAALPLLILGIVSRETMMRWREKLHRSGKRGKILLGAILLAIGLLILTGADKRLETFLVEVSPAWLTQLTTSF